MPTNFQKRIEAPWLPTVLAAAALALGAYNALVSRQQPALGPGKPPPVAEASERGRSVEAGRNELQLATIARLSDRLDRLEAEVAKLRTQAPAGAAAGGAPVAAAPHPPRWRFFKVSSSAITVQPSPDGTGEPIVTNTDPALTGKRMAVDATADDGTMGQVNIVVPPPK